MDSRARRARQETRTAQRAMRRIVRIARKLVASRCLSPLRTWGWAVLATPIHRRPIQAPSTAQLAQSTQARLAGHTSHLSSTSFSRPLRRTACRGLPPACVLVTHCRRLLLLLVPPTQSRPARVLQQYPASAYRTLPYLRDRTTTQTTISPSSPSFPTTRPPDHPSVDPSRLQHRA